MLAILWGDGLSWVYPVWFFSMFILANFDFPHCCLSQALAVSDHFPVEVNLIGQELAAWIISQRLMQLLLYDGEQSAAAMVDSIKISTRISHYSFIDETNM